MLHVFDFPAVPNRAETSSYNAEWFKAGGAHRKEFLIDWNNEQFSLSTLKPKGQRALLLKEQTGVVLSAQNQPAVALLRLCCVCEFALFEARRSRRYSMAWLEPNRVRRPVRGDVLVVVIGALCWHPGSTACWRDNRPSRGRAGGERESDHPPFNTMWPGLHPGCGQLKSEPVMHICALFYCCSILRRYVQRATNKAQFHLVPIYPAENSPPLPPLCLPLSPRVETHLDTHRHALQRMQRYRSYIEGAFQRSPHGVDDRVLLKRKKAGRGRLQVWRGY